jgi:rubrerythrin
VPTASIDLSRLTLRDALDLAILIEEEAEERYGELADELEVHHTPEAASYFRHMSEHEAHHRGDLRERRQRLFPGAERQVSRAMLWDVKAPGFDQAHMFMSLREAMETALGADEKAREFFETAIRSAGAPEVKALFEELRDEEAHSAEEVRNELAHLPPEGATIAEDSADEPVGQ